LEHVEKAARERLKRQRRRLPALALGVGFGIYLKDGAICCFGNAIGRQELEGRKNVAAVAAGRFHSVALGEDGKVFACGTGASGQLDVSTWHGIVAIAACSDYTVGVTGDGRVEVAGYSATDWFRGWSQISRISAAGDTAVGLRRDGTAVTTNKKLHVSSWKGLTDVRAGDGFAAGLTSERKVLFCGIGLNDSLDVSQWSGIISIEASSDRIYGVNSLGKAFSVGSDNDKMARAMEEWPKIDAISASNGMCAGMLMGKPIAVAGGTTGLLRSFWEMVERVS
jgi:alpha-tubulin suppressor-like RCC1 family protein